MKKSKLKPIYNRFLSKYLLVALFLVGLFLGISYYYAYNYASGPLSFLVETPMIAIMTDESCDKSGNCIVVKQTQGQATHNTGATVTDTRTGKSTRITNKSKDGDKLDLAIAKVAGNQGKNIIIEGTLDASNCTMKDGKNPECDPIIPKKTSPMLAAPEPPTPPDVPDTSGTTTAGSETCVQGTFGCPYTTITYSGDEGCGGSVAGYYCWKDAATGEYKLYVINLPATQKAHADRLAAEGLISGYDGDGSEASKKEYLNSKGIYDDASIKNLSPQLRSKAPPAPPKGNDGLPGGKEETPDAPVKCGSGWILSSDKQSCSAPKTITSTEMNNIVRRCEESSDKAIFDMGTGVCHLDGKLALSPAGLAKLETTKTCKPGLQDSGSKDGEQMFVECPTSGSKSGAVYKFCTGGKFIDGNCSLYSTTTNTTNSSTPKVTIPGTTGSLANPVTAAKEEVITNPISTAARQTCRDLVSKNGGECFERGLNADGDYVVRYVPPKPTTLDSQSFCNCQPGYKCGRLNICVYDPNDPVNAKPTAGSLNVGESCDNGWNSSCKSNDCRKVSNPSKDGLGWYCVEHDDSENIMSEEGNKVLKWKNDVVCKSDDMCTSNYCERGVVFGIFSYRTCQTNPFTQTKPPAESDKESSLTTPLNIASNPNAAINPTVAAIQDSGGSTLNIDPLTNAGQPASNVSGGGAKSAMPASAVDYSSPISGLTSDGSDMQELYLWYKDHEEGWWYNELNPGEEFTPAHFLGVMLIAESTGNSSDTLDAITLATSNQLWGSSSEHKPYCQTPSCAEGIFNFTGAYMQSARERYKNLIANPNPKTAEAVIREDTKNVSNSYIDHYRSSGLTIGNLAEKAVFKPISQEFSNNSVTDWGATLSDLGSGPNSGWIPRAAKKAGPLVGTTNQCGIYRVESYPYGNNQTGYEAVFTRGQIAAWQNGWCD